MKGIKLSKLLVLTLAIFSLVIGLFSISQGKTYRFGGGSDLCEDLCPGKVDYCEIQCNDYTGHCILICYYAL